MESEAVGHRRTSVVAAGIEAGVATETETGVGAGLGLGLRLSGLVERLGLTITYQSRYQCRIVGKRWQRPSNAK